MRRPIVVVVALLVLAGCASFPDNQRWPNGIPVHPRMVPNPPASGELERASCFVGLSSAGQALFERYLEDPYAINIEEWQWWFINDGAEIPNSVNDCVNAWMQQRATMRFAYWCGKDLHEYWLPHDEFWIGYFTQTYVCDGDGFAFWVCPGGCAGIYGAVTEPQPPPVIGDAPDGSRAPVDPAEPTPPKPIVCTPDPRDTRMCLEMESS